MFEKIKALFSGNKNVFKNKERCILIVDDSQIDRLLIDKIVRELGGYRILSAENGQQGLDIAKSEKPDLVILDCDMPVMTGHQMCQILKNDPKLKDIKVLFLTGINTPENVIQCFELDAQNYLPKPINAQDLIKEIKNIFNEK